VTIEKETLKYRKANSWCPFSFAHLSQLLALSRSSNELIRVVKKKVVAGIKIIELARELI